ncbi:MAG TPA: GGDEF domain-containing protein [Myxococcota bacterium]|nr:GGDEF domain-containing protein [Myxococcota bacterium]
MRNERVLEQLPEAIARAENLPSPPTVALEVLRLTRDENAEVGELTRVLAFDPALSAKLLKLANSSLFRRGESVTTLDKATMRLGLKTVKLMALSFSLTSGLSRKPEGVVFDYAEYWRRSLTMAVAGRALADLVEPTGRDEAFLCGLLGRIGQIVIAQCLPEEYPPLLDAAEGALPSASLERDFLGFDFHDVGSALLASWDLPELISQTVLAWGDPGRLPEEANEPVARLTQVMHGAGLMSEVLCDPHHGGCALSNLHAVVQDAFGLSEQEIDAVLVGLEESVSEMAEMLDVQIARESYQEIVDRARAQLVQISLGTALDLEQTSHRAVELERQNLALASQANTDKLTGIPNRSHFDAVLEKLIGDRPEGSPARDVGLLMIDVDHFKRFNDTHGHAVGDEVLKLVARSLQSAIRESDVVARYGGEEFAVIVPETSLATLQGVAERIRARIEEAVHVHDGVRLAVTASVGGACAPRLRSAAEASRLLAAADACLYAAKADGRNTCDCQRVEDLGEGS